MRTIFSCSSKQSAFENLFTTETPRHRVYTEKINKSFAFLASLRPTPDLHSSIQQEPNPLVFTQGFKMYFTFKYNVSCTTGSTPTGLMIASNSLT